MATREPQRLIVYTSTLNPQGIGVAKAILSAFTELQALGFEVALRRADLTASILDAGWNAIGRIYAILFDGIGLGFRYGSLLNMLSSAVLRPRVFLTWHEDRWVYSRLMRERPLRGRVFNKLMKSKALHHLVISKRAKSFCQSLGVQDSRIRIVGGCVSPPDETARDIRVFPSDDRVRIVATSSIQARKGTDIFCQAAIKVCQNLPQVDFFWIGRPLGFEPGFFETCRNLVRRSGFDDRIQFCGFVERPDIYMAHCDMFVQTSRDEPLGLSALEAMAFGKTVIGFDVGGLPELMAGCYHVLGQPNADELAEKIIELASGHRENLLREDARTRALEFFSPKEYAARLARAIRSVTEE